MLDTALKQRLLTAAVLIPLFMWLVLGGATALVALVLALVVLLGAKEWAALFNWQGRDRAAFIVLTAVLLALTYDQARSGVEALWLWVIAVGGWCAASAWLWRHREQAIEGHAPDWLGRVPPVLLGVWVLVPSYSALISMHRQGDWGPGMMLFCLTLMWVADTAAYFAGRRFGERKLAPAISPGKSVEGAMGAAAATMVWAIGGYLLLDPPVASAFGFVVVCFVAVGFSIFGDLFESQMKRLSHVKDSGHLLPGHGGVLDRIDSTTAGAPVFALGLWLLG